jgi:hypothetical protein
MIERGHADTTGHVVTDTGVRAVDPFTNSPDARAFLCSCGCEFAGVIPLGTEIICPDSFVSDDPLGPECS